MYYTKLIIENREDMTLNDAYYLAMEERWKLVADGSGRTKYFKMSSDVEWTENPGVEAKTAQESKDHWDEKWSGGIMFPASHAYLGVVKIWNTQQAAQDWVDRVTALNLDGVSISYHGNTDPITPTV